MTEQPGLIWNAQLDAAFVDAVLECHAGHGHGEAQRQFRLSTVIQQMIHETWSAGLGREVVMERMKALLDRKIA